MHVTNPSDKPQEPLMGCHENPDLERSVLMVVCLTTFVTPFMLSGINIALPHIQSTFASSAVALSWVTTSYLLATAVFLVPMGRLADMYGRWRFFLAGVVLFVVSSLGSGLAGSMSMLLAMRVVQGLGGAMIQCTGVAILACVFPPAFRGRAMGFQVASVYLGLSLGPFVGGWMTNMLGWRSVFLTGSAVGLYAFGLACVRLPREEDTTQGERFDLAGSVIYGLSLAGLVIGAPRLPGLSGWLLVMGGVAGLVVFIRMQKQGAFPVVNMRIFTGNRVFAFSNLAALIHYSGSYAVMFLLSLYLQYIKGMQAHTAGMILVCQPVFQAVLSPLAGRLSDRMEPGIIASVGMGMTALGLIGFAFLDEGFPLLAIMSILCFMGIGFALFSSPNMNAIMGSVTRKNYGLAAGISSTMRTLGMLVSMGTSTVLFAAMLGTAPIEPATYPIFLHTVRLCFLVFACMCAVGIIFSLVRGKIHG
ncbi:MFS transporter [Desulfoplanes formicivorans]|uniref:MFS transporter n=1 Tax=Desulfoplanes formicivorans TaxID=1592317 RepID=A0A194AJX9_9BACT|nr:MFS transporter [Desulfoplanes formicivorans]GAU09029.1 MFS transporter [Desulfoplanes formicivorans]